MLGNNKGTHTRQMTKLHECNKKMFKDRVLKTKACDTNERAITNEIMFIDVHGKASVRRKTLYVYIIKDGNPSTKSTRHVKANVNTWKENQNNNQISSNEVEDLMLKGHPLQQIN